MSYLPYHHDWPLAMEARIGLRVHWFGRYAGFPEWSVEKSRLMGDMLCFFYVESESCWVVINGVRMVLQTGDLLVVRGGDEFAYGHDPKRPHVSLAVSLAVEYGGVVNELLHRDFKRRYSLKEPQAFVAEFEKVLFVMGSEGPYRDLAITGAILQWLTFVLQNLRPPMARTNLEARTAVDRILAAEAWAMNRLKEDITITAWSRAVSLNPDYFARIFKRETGRRPMAWLNERRLQMAAQLLGNTRKTVAEVAEVCGFNCPFYLSRIFKKQFGIAPQNYRQNHLQPCA